MCKPKLLLSTGVIHCVDERVTENDPPPQVGKTDEVSRTVQKVNVVSHTVCVVICNCFCLRYQSDVIMLSKMTSASSRLTLMTHSSVLGGGGQWEWGRWAAPWSTLHECSQLSPLRQSSFITGIYCSLVLLGSLVSTLQSKKQTKVACFSGIFGIFMATLNSRRTKVRSLID